MFNSPAVKSPAAILSMQECGQRLSVILKALYKFCQAGVTGVEVNDYALKLMNDLEVKPSFLNYHGFPAVVCVSVNDVVLHGIPTAVAFVDGDLVSIDVGIIYQKHHTDAAFSKIIGKHPSPDDVKLLNATKAALDQTIMAVRPNLHLHELSVIMYNVVTKNNFTVCYDYCGHGIGLKLHEPPQIPNHPFWPDTGFVIKTNMTFAIEVMVIHTNQQTSVDQDHWTVRSVDGKNTCHFEKTVLVTPTGCQILTDWE